MNTSFDSFKNCYIFVCVYFTNGTTVTFINVILFMISGVFIFHESSQNFKPSNLCLSPFDTSF